MARGSFVLVAVFCLVAKTVSAQLISSVPDTPLLELQAGRVIPDVINTLATPASNISVVFPGNATVAYGNELTANQTQNAPSVTVINGTAAAGQYTLTMSDPDVPDPAVATVNSSYLHWLVVNISGTATTNITTTGVALAPYQAPSPPSGLHRYVIQLYRQNANSTIGNTTITRSGFLPKAFAATYNLGNPVAVVYFRQEPANGSNLTTNSSASVVETEALVNGRLIPSVVPLFTPLATLNVSYANGTLSYGQIVLPTEVASPPSVVVQGLTPGTIYNSTFPYFTLVLVDPDAPDPTTPTSANILHYLKVNIPTNTPTANIVNLTDGNVLQPYASPSPNTGLHRYTFVLYGQGRLSNVTAPASRTSFNLTNFALNNTLGNPIAGFYFNSLKAATTAAATSPSPGPAPGPAPVPAPVPASAPASAPAFAPAPALLTAKSPSA